MKNEKITLKVSTLDNPYRDESYMILPKALIKDECFGKLSTAAIIVYCAMLDREKLSRKNGWVDDQGEVYIVYTLEQIMQCVHCRKEKAAKILKELDEETGVGLIRREKQRIGKPNRIYVKIDEKYRTEDYMILPKALLENECFGKLSTAAVIVYCAMLDREKLSRKNGWTNAQGEVYIAYTLEQIMQCAHCRIEKAIKILKELDEETGIGLIRREKQRVGKPNHIYVKTIIRGGAAETDGNREDNSKVIPLRKCGQDNQGIKDGQVVKSGLVKNEPDQVVKSSLLKGEPGQLLKNRSEQVRKSNTINNNTIKTNKSNTNLINQMEVDEKTHLHIMAEVKKQIEYNILKIDYPSDGKIVDELLDIIVDVLESPAKTIRVNREEKEAGIVKSRYRCLERAHIEYALGGIKKSETAARNVRAWLITTLYNAAITMHSGYSNWVASNANAAVVDDRKVETEKAAEMSDLEKALLRAR